MTRWLLLGVCCSFACSAYAGIQAELNRQLVEAARPHTDLPSYDILFERRCEMIEKYLGYDDTAISRAMQFSCQGTQIGIALYVGPDFGDYPPEQIRKVYKEKIDEEGLASEVYIEKDPTQGSHVIFFINGESYMRNRIGPVEALEKIITVTAEAKLTYIDSGQAEGWIPSKRMKERMNSRDQTE